ncbi:MAG: hypothetical protein V4565_10890 [Bacteroidota bacterium]
MSENITYDKIALLNELESYLYKVNKKYINDFPITRIQIGYFLEMYDLQMVNKSSISKNFEFKKHSVNWRSFKKLIKLRVKLFFLRFRYNNLLAKKVLLFGFVEHFKVHPNGENVNLYLSPIKKELKRNSVEFDELLISNSQSKTDLTPIKELYDVLSEYNYLLFSFKAKLFNNYKETEKQAKCIHDFLETKMVSGSVHCVNLYYKTKVTNEILYNTFKQLIEILNPRLIWTYCFYDNCMLAMCKAANHNKIEIVEYQHSQQSDIHFAYAKWNLIDIYRYYFPSIFWVWSEEDADRIRKNFLTQQYIPKIIVGGNVAAIQQQQIYNYKDPTAGTGILISLTGEWIPTFLEKVIEADSMYTWYFRLHPRYPSDANSLELFKNKYPQKIETLSSNTLSLFELFTLVTFNITATSGTALEAEYFGVKNIITGDAGKFIFRDKIESNKYSYVSNELELSEKIYKHGVTKIDSYKTSDLSLSQKLNEVVRELFMGN